jgi:hypothetical protein
LRPTAGRQCGLRAAGGAVERPRRAQHRPCGSRRPSAMRALLPLLSVGRGWRVGAAARPPRRVMSLYRTEELGHPRSQDYRLFFSKSFAQLRAGRRRGRGAVPCPALLCPAGSAARAQARCGGDRSRCAGWRGANRPLQRPQPARGAELLPLTSAPWPAARPRRLLGAAKPIRLRTAAELWGPGSSLRKRVCLRPRPCCQRRRTGREEVGGECEPGAGIGLCAQRHHETFCLVRLT